MSAPAGYKNIYVVEEDMIVYEKINAFLFLSVCN